MSTLETAAPPAGPAPGGSPVPGPRDPRSGARRRYLVPAVPAAVTLAVCLAGLSGPSYWIDEAATISMTQRSLPDFWRTVDHLDVVHALYYLLLRPWAAVFGTGEVALRFPSAAAMALAAAVVALLGRRCASPAVGMFAGLAFGCSVTVTRYAQDARPFAMVVLVVAASTYLFVRMTQERRRLWRWSAGYAAGLVLVCLFNVFALMVVAAHAVTLLWLHRAGRVERRDLVRWAVSAGTAGLLLAPFAYKARHQSGQVVIIPLGMGDELWQFLVFLAGGQWLVPVVAVLAVLGATAPVARTAAAPVARSGAGAGDRRPGPSLLMVAVPWLLIPPALLLAANAFDSIFRPRYVLFCLPALALLVGAGLAWLGGVRRELLAGALAVAVAAALPAHLAIREQGERNDDLRAAADVLREHARPGDAVLFLTPDLRWRAQAYPDAFEGLHDVMLGRTGPQAANLVGTDISDGPTLRRRLLQSTRVWVMRDSTFVDFPPPDLQWRLRTLHGTGPYTMRTRWRHAGGNLTLLVRRGSGSTAGWPMPEPRPKGPVRP
ncbi:mannosyltransferase [Thermomonospora echinospora]|uniref:Mannosyltransferase n=1 Tax=Thermomonospora echinospora TaxID=1992 RepID=A0A1H6DMV8_9ACTN|nr:glycosyltransferase family 39 protein [Thermomonospora echinospora]SEG86036.1 mannosyltransferase [Thermomonospora echinospora]